jgi:hypothetical protein
MADEWVSEVRNWYFSTSQEATTHRDVVPLIEEIGYEAAYPELQTRDWIETAAALGTARR